MLRHATSRFRRKVTPAKPGWCSVPSCFQLVNPVEDGTNGICLNCTEFQSQAQQGPLAQLAEARDLKSPEYGFESHEDYNTKTNPAEVGRFGAPDGVRDESHEDYQMQNNIQNAGTTNPAGVRDG